MAIHIAPKIISRPVASKPTGNKKRRGKYIASRDHEALRVAMLNYFTFDGGSYEFCKKHTIVKRPTLERHYKESGLSKLRKDHASIQKSDVTKIVNLYLQNLANKKQQRTASASLANRIMTDHEEYHLVAIIKALAAVGYGITKEEVLELTNSYLLYEDGFDYIDIDASEIQVSEKFFRNLQKRHAGEIKIVSAGSLDNQRSEKATIETRDAQFAKIDAYIHNLHCMHKLPWATFQEIPPERIYGMDEIGIDTTKHRSAVVTDANSECRLHQVTNEGDGRMDRHITIALTTCADGLYQDTSTKGCTKGGPTPMIIHTDKKKTRELEKEERGRQRMGKEAKETDVDAKFTNGLNEDFIVRSTFNGSMTQETFLDFAKHFVATKPDGPCILILDGHGSRWNVQALRYLLVNEVYPFFLASYTSIWGQPNDLGTNKRLHAAVARSVRKTRKAVRKGKFNMSQLNKIISEAWDIFLAIEKNELLSPALSSNACTRSWERSGLSPYDPFAKGWTEAIESLGQGKRKDAFALPSYEIFLRSSPEPLSASEEALLTKNSSIIQEGSIRIGKQLLAHWHEKALSSQAEGQIEVLLTPESSFSPENVNVEAFRAALKMISFRKVADVVVATPKETPRSNYSATVLDSMTPVTPVKFLMQTDDHGWVEALVVMGSGESSFDVRSAHLKEQVLATREELLDTLKFRLVSVFQGQSSVDSNKVAAEKKRKQALVARQEEKEIEAVAQMKRCENDLLEWNSFCSKFSIHNSDEMPKSFVNMIARLRQPFKTAVDERSCIVGEEGDSAIMMRASSLEFVTKQLWGTQDSQPETKKKRRANATVNIHFGATGQDTLDQSEARDIRQADETAAKNVRSLRREKENIDKALGSMDTRKQCLQNEASSHYFQLAESAATADIVLFLRLFAPSSGKLSKPKGVQLQYLRENNHLRKTKIQMDAKLDEIERRREEINRILEVEGRGDQNIEDTNTEQAAG